MTGGWKLTWFGHSAFRLEAGRTVILLDPFLTGNPSFGGDIEQATAGATHILLTHGHDDHVGDTVAIAARTGASVVANFEVCTFLSGRGVSEVNPGNTGGTVACGEFTVAFTQALHSSGTVVDGVPVYLGNPNGLVIRHPDAPTIYAAGDTDVFSDMALIAELHQPAVGILPIGDRFTMNARTAAFAARRFFHFDVVIPCHYGSFPPLARDAAEFVSALEGGPRVVVPVVGEAVTLA